MSEERRIGERMMSEIPVSKWPQMAEAMAWRPQDEAPAWMEPDERALFWREVAAANERAVAFAAMDAALAEARADIYAALSGPLLLLNRPAAALRALAAKLREAKG